MKILLVDQFSNALEPARALLRSESCKPECVVVMTNTACSILWKDYGVEVVPCHQQVSSIVEYVKEQSFDLVCNFSSLLGSQGLCEALRSEGIAVFGSDATFSGTEFNKADFKEWLTTRGFSTPAIVFSGSCSQVVDHVYSFRFPVVIKSSVLFGPITTVIYKPDDLGAYFSEAKNKWGVRVDKAEWLVEKFVDHVDTVSIGYVVGNGKSKVLATSRIDFSEKTQTNPIGGQVSYNPHPQESQIILESERLVSCLAEDGFSGLGFFQALIDKDGQLMIMENNARPSIGAMYDKYRDFYAVISAARNGDVSSLTDKDIFLDEFLKDDGSYGRKALVMVPLLQDKPGIRVSVENITSEDVVFLPFSIRKLEDGFLSEQAFPPSGFASYSNTIDRAKDKLSDIMQRLHDSEGLINPL